MSDTVTIELGAEEVDALLRRAALIDRQAIAAYTGKPVNADAIFRNIDTVLDILTQGDTTGAFERARQDFDAERRRESVGAMFHTR